MSPSSPLATSFEEYTVKIESTFTSRDNTLDSVSWNVEIESTYNININPSDHLQELKDDCLCSFGFHFSVEIWVFGRTLTLWTLCLVVVMRPMVGALENAIPALQMLMHLNLVMSFNLIGTSNFSTLTQESIHTIFCQGTLSRVQVIVLLDP